MPFGAKAQKTGFIETDRVTDRWMDQQRLMERPMDGLRDEQSILQTCEDASKNQARQLILNQSPKGKRWSSGTLSLLSGLFMVSFEVSRATAPNGNEVL